MARNKSSRPSPGWGGRSGRSSVRPRPRPGTPGAPNIPNTPNTPNTPGGPGGARGTGARGAAGRVDPDAPTRPSSTAYPHPEPPTVPYDSPPFPPERGGPGVPRKLTVTRVAAARTRELTGRAVRAVGAASRADGAAASGLSGLIWTNATQMAGDAMIAVCLAGTIFFSAATSQQRTNVALYLLITVAPFAVVAPVLGPLLDRLHHGRRFALAGTMLGRAFLAYVMAANFDNIGLYPAAFGTLVLSKAYGVLKGACVPRVLPDRMTLVAANARLSLFGLGASLAAGGLLGAFVRLSGSYPWALRITAVVFAWGAFRALRLPSHVDSSEGEVAATVIREVTGRRLWGRQTLGGQVVSALRAAGALRGMSGFLTLFMAFLVQQDEHGTAALLALGAVAGGVAVGSVAGTALGARLRLARPDVIVLVCVGSTAAVCVLAALSYSIQTAVLLGLVAGLTNSLGKLCLDAIIQRDVAEHMRASAFGRSETLLQLAWVFGGGLGIALPSNGRIGFAVAAALLVAAFALALAGRRAPARDGGSAEGTARTPGTPGTAGAPGAPGAAGSAGQAAGNLGSTDPHPAG